MIELDDMVKKHKACIKALDKGKTCQTCKHNKCSEDVEPCSECFDSMIGLPVNPTNWEAV